MNLYQWYAHNLALTPYKLVVEFYSIAHGLIAA